MAQMRRTVYESVGPDFQVSGVICSAWQVGLPSPIGGRIPPNCHRWHQPESAPAFATRLVIAGRARRLALDSLDSQANLQRRSKHPFQATTKSPGQHLAGDAEAHPLWAGRGESPHNGAERYPIGLPSHSPSTPWLAPFLSFTRTCDCRFCQQSLTANIWQLFSGLAPIQPPCESHPLGFGQILSRDPGRNWTVACSTDFESARPKVYGRRVVVSQGCSAAAGRGCHKLLRLAGPVGSGTPRYSRASGYH